MKKSISIILSFAMVLSLCVFCVPVFEVKAAEDLIVEFNKTYKVSYAEWRDNHYKIVIPEKGIVTITAKFHKTTTGRDYPLWIWLSWWSEEKEKTMIETYNEYETRNNSEEGAIYKLREASENTYTIGLKPGSYSLGVATVDVDLSLEDTIAFVVTYKKTDYGDIEINDDIDHANEILSGYTYTGYNNLHEERDYQKWGSTGKKDDFDYYVYNGVEGETITINVVTPYYYEDAYNFYSDWSFGVYDDSKNKIIWKDAGGKKEAFRLTFDSSGKCYICVRIRIATPKTYTIKIASDRMSIDYRTQVQKEGWQSWKRDGQLSGTKTNKRLEGIQIKVQNPAYSGGVQYKTYIQKKGWESAWVKNGKTSGTVGQALRLEGIKIQLTGELGKNYGVYYRTYVEKFGWLGWAKNGERSGTAGYAYKLEGIQIRLVKNGDKVPKSSTQAFKIKGK